MTIFAFIRQCLRKEAKRTEPNCKKTIELVLEEEEKKCQQTNEKNCLF